MGRILGIDFGTKRVGLAVTDNLQIAAHGLKTVDRGDAVEFISSYVAEEQVEQIVIGAPGNPSREFERALKQFVGKLRHKTPDIDILFEEEDFTSAEAMEVMRAAGVKQKDRKNKAYIDQVSAILILQRYLGHID